MEPACPLCASPDSRLIETVMIGDLESEYQRQFRVAVRQEFPSALKSLSLRHCNRCELDFFSPCVAGSSSFYEALGQAQGYYSPERWEFDEIIRRLPADADLIDIGCGDGKFLRRVPGSRKRGLELNQDAVRRARQQGLNVAEELLAAVPDASADYLTLFHVLEHVNSPVGLMSDAARVLRPGGRFFISVPNNDAFVGSSIHDPMNAPPHHLLRWRAVALRYLEKLTPFGLERITAEPLDSSQLYHYRRASFVAALEKPFGRRIPRHRVSLAMTFVRRLANLYAFTLQRLAPTPPANTPGLSLLAEFRRR